MARTVPVDCIEQFVDTMVRSDDLSEDKHKAVSETQSPQRASSADAEANPASDSPVQKRSPARSPPPAPFGIDTYGFFVASEDQGFAPAPGEESTVDRERREQELSWWVGALRSYRTMRTGVFSSSDPLSDPGIPLSKVPPLQRGLLREMRRRIRCGLASPHARRVVWPLLIGAFDAPHGQYESLTQSAVPFETNEVILRDLPRTFPTHCLFVNPHSYGQAALHRVLAAYCNLDSEVGYCQGMGFLVAILLLHLPEEAAFWTFAQMMQGKRYDLRRLYLPDFPLLQHFFIVLRRTMRDLLPALAAHFEEQGVDVSFFASQWFLTLFAYQLPIPMVCRVWDLFFSEGWKMIFRFTIALLQMEASQLVEMRMENILLHLKTIHEGKDIEDVIRQALEVPVNDEDLCIESAF